MMSPNQSVLPQHLLSQLLRPYMCSLCHKTFKKKNHLTRHVKIHSDIRQHKCPYCGKAFLRSDNLKKHIRIHTGEKFLCQFCSRGFTDGSNLTKHVRTHTGEGRHRCKFCHRHFAGLVALQRHMQEHDKMRFVINTSLVKTEVSDDLSCMDQNYSKMTESLQQIPKLSSPLRLSERNENPPPDKIFLEETDTFRSDHISPINYREPFTAFTSGNAKETINPIKDLSSGMQDDMSLLLKQFQLLPQKSPQCLAIEKQSTPSAIKIEKLTNHNDIPNFSDFLPEQAFLDNSININQDVSLLQCLLCPEEFSSYPSLLKHLRSHINDSIPIPEKWDCINTESIETSPAEQLTCRYCKRVFTRQTELLSHMDLTLCKNCGKIFACSVLLNQHKETCKINWMDKEVINEYGDEYDNNEGNCKIPEERTKNNSRSKNLSSDSNDFPSLTTVKQEVIFPKIEDQASEQQLPVYKSSPLPLVDSSLSHNGILPLRTMKNNLVDTSRSLTDSNIVSREKTNSDSNQEMLAKTVLDSSQISEIFDSGLSILSQAEPLGDGIISGNSQMPSILSDSQKRNLGEDISDPTEDFSFNVSVFDAYRCAKNAFNNSSWTQDFNLSSALSEFDTQSSQIICKNCRKHFHSISEFREHLKFLKKFFNNFSLKNSHKHRPVKNGFNSCFPHNSSVRLERKSIEADFWIESRRSENAQNQCFSPRKVVRSPKNHSLVLTCSYCQKSFARSSQLNRHRKIHLGIKNHRCTFCSKTFLRSDNLKKHLRIHLGIKQYACSVCKKRFTDSSNLVKHQRIHNVNRGTHFCNLCNRNFLNYQSLRKHMQTHKEEQTTPDQFLNDNAAELILPKIPQRSSDVHAASRNSQNIQNNPFSELGSSRKDQLNSAQMSREKKSDHAVDKNGDITECDFNSDPSNLHMQCSTEPTTQFCSSDSLEQNQILLGSAKATMTSKYKTVFPLSSKELSVHSPPHNVAAQYLEGQQSVSLMSSNQNEELENFEVQRWNLCLNAPHLAAGPSASVKSEISEHSEASSVKICASPTEKIKDNLTVDTDFEEKMLFNPSMQKVDVSERQQRYKDSLSELSSVNSKFKNNANTSQTNFSPEFVSTKTEPISENSDSLTTSSASFADNMTEDKLEMSAYYCNSQNVPNNFIRPIAKELRLTEACNLQDKKLKEYSVIYGTFQNSLNSTSDNSGLRNVAISLH